MKKGSGSAAFLAAIIGAAAFLLARGSAEARWSGAEELGEGGSPRVAVWDNGTAMAIWGEIKGEYPCRYPYVYAMRFDGSSWRKPEEIYQGSVQIRIDDIAVSDDGSAIVLFRNALTYDEFWGVCNDMLVAARYSGEEWETEIIAIGRYLQPGRVVMDESGAALAIYIEYETFRPMARRYTPKDGWQEPEDIGSMESLRARDYSIAMNDGGRAILIWEEESAGQVDLCCRIFEEEGWGDISVIDGQYSDFWFGPYFNPRAAIDNSGTGFVAYCTQRTEAEGRRIHARRIRDGAEHMYPALSVPEPEAYDIAMCGNGKAILAYSTSFMNNHRIYARRFDGTAWAGPIIADKGSSYGAAEDPLIVGSENGRAVIVFAQGEKIGARVHTGTSWGSAQWIDDGESRSFSNHDVAITENGSRAVAVYCAHPFTIFANRYYW